jgi:twitching motility protein PilU
VSDLIEKGEIGQIKTAREKSLSPGSQSFDSALANSDTPTNLLWLLNNTPVSANNAAVIAQYKVGDAGANFTEFTLNT